MRNLISSILMAILLTTAICSPATANTDRLTSEPIDTVTAPSAASSKASSSMKSGFWENLVNGVLSALHDVAVNQRIKSDIVEACSFLDRHDTYRALQVLNNTQRRLRNLNDHSYRRLSEQLGAICSDIRNGNVSNARTRLHYVERRLNVQGHSNHNNNTGSYPGHHGNNNNGYNTGNNNNGYNTGNNNGGYQNSTSYQDLNFYRSIQTTLRTSLNYLRTNNASVALRGIRQVDAALAQRNTNLDRQLRQTTVRIQEDIRRNRFPYAINKLQTMERQIRDAITSASNGSYNPNPGYNPTPGYNPNPGQHNGLSQQERRNRREWMRDIRDLIDTIRDNNIQMAKRDLRRLVSDIRSDGNGSSFNRGLMQQLQFAGVSLNHGFPDIRSITRSLKQISRKIETSLK